MFNKISSAFFVIAGLVLAPFHASAEIVAMMNYETKSKDSLKALKISGNQDRQEGIALVDVDPSSDQFGKILASIPLPADLVAHHIFYEKTMNKAYITSLGQSVVHTIDMGKYPYRLKAIDVPNCKAGEDIVFSDDNSTWYLTCMGTSQIVVGDTASDEVTAVIKLDMPYPHGIAINNSIDRMLVTSTVRETDLGDAREMITVIRPSTNEVLSSHKVSNKPSPSGEAPVEVLFAPGANPPVAYINNMYGGTMWRAEWNANSETFAFSQAFDFASLGAGVPLELYFNDDVTRLYATTAQPGQMHIFDISKNAAEPKLLKSLPAAEGAHHIAFTQDGKYAYVQNSLLNLPGMSDGSVTVIDMTTEEVIASIDTLKDLGLNPNCIVLLPEWNALAGH